MQAESQLGETAETYLVGYDLELRSKLRRDKKREIINEKILTEQTKLLQLVV